MQESHHDVRASDLPVCPFCNGDVYYSRWVTHKLFQMECENCKARWRTGIKKNGKRDMYVELITSMNPEISQEYFEKELPLAFWQNMIKEDKKGNNSK